MAWFAIIHMFLHISSYPLCLPFPNHQLFLHTIFFITFSKLATSWKPCLTSPSWCHQSFALHLWKQFISYHIKLVNIVLSLVKSLLDIVLPLPEIRILHTAAQLGAIINLLVCLNSQLESGRDQGRRGGSVRLSVQLPLRSCSLGSWVWAPHRALCWQHRAWSLVWVLCLPLSLLLPRSCSVSLSFKS